MIKKIKELQNAEEYERANDLVSEATSHYNTFVKENIIKAISEFDEAIKVFEKLGEYNRPPRKLKLSIKIDDGTKFKDRISTYICKSKNQLPRKSNDSLTMVEICISQKQNCQKTLEDIAIAEQKRKHDKKMASIIIPVSILLIIGTINEQI